MSRCPGAMFRRLLSLVLMLAYCLSVIGWGDVGSVVSSGCRCSEKAQAEKTCCCRLKRGVNRPSCCAKKVAKSSNCCGKKNDQAPAQRERDSNKPIMPTLTNCSCGGSPTLLQTLDDPRDIANPVRIHNVDAASPLVPFEFEITLVVSKPETPPPRI